MEVKETLNEGLKRAYEVVVQSHIVENELNTRIKDLQSKIKIDGFRPGKVPASVVKKKHGEAILGEVLEKVISESSMKLLKEHNLRPAIQPKIDITSYEDGKDLVFTTAVEIFPDVPEVKWEKITLEKWVAKPEESEQKERLDRLADTYREWEPLKEDRKTKEGDKVIIDFEGFIDGEAFDGGKAEDFHLILGSKNLIPGFEEQLVGKAKGELVEVKVTFPEDYNEASLAGKEALFKTTIKEILAAADAVIDDCLAEKVGYESLDKLKEALHEQIGQQYESLTVSKLKKELFDYLDENIKFDVPEGMLVSEKKILMETLSKANEQEEDKKEKKTAEELEKEAGKIAERRVRLGIILAETGRKEEVEIPENDIRQAMWEQAMRFPGQEEKVLDFYRNNPNAVEELKGPILEEKVVEIIIEKAAVTEKEVNIDELIKVTSEGTEA